MEKDIKQKLIESYVPKLWMANTADDIRKILNDYSDAYDSINCLEAKPKALHSMKEAKEICTFCGSPEISWYGNDDDKTFFCFNCNKVQSDCIRPSRGH